MVSIRVKIKVMHNLMMHNDKSRVRPGVSVRVKLMGS